ncbi:hypothetical protein [Rathayibacter tanaceti]|uniref:Uncharacterized protein n=2 Tax=Rathayibacter tanaceti TaxID=1671680 RepID=A0ACD2XJU6_9MICO|nr:hypothetical protein [Rathayibacter tanaceti]KZX22541.1 hypothetical protein ACH61_00307 [Rathayibacter tanaceti]TCO37396.1 hypothetical protein EV639_10461 [Rathayibacter tanaceti]
MRPSITDGAVVDAALHAVSTTWCACRLPFAAPGFIGVSVSPGATEKIRRPWLRCSSESASVKRIT